MPKKSLFLFLALSMIIISCAPKNGINAEETAKINYDADSEIITVQPLTAEKQGLGNLCSGEDKCKYFCSNNRGRCEAYCRGKEIELCRIIFPPNAHDQGPQDNRGCRGKGTVEFTYPPMLIEDIGMIEPIGLMIGGHVTPIDHGYYTSKTWT